MFQARKIQSAGEPECSSALVETIGLALPVRFLESWVCAGFGNVWCFIFQCLLMVWYFFDGFLAVINYSMVF